MGSNYGFPGAVPTGVSVEDNVARALAYQATHTTAETIEWFYNVVRNNKDGHLPTAGADASMDYKQLGGQYQDFGNFNYAVVGKALGFPDLLLKYGAGVAQGRANGKSLPESIIRSLLDPRNKGDNPEDQAIIQDGINPGTGDVCNYGN